MNIAQVIGVGAGLVMIASLVVSRVLPGTRRAEWMVWALAAYTIALAYLFVGPKW